MTTQEVIKSLRMIKSTCYIGNRKFLDALEQAIEMLEAQEWVPCKERLPESDEDYKSCMECLDGAVWYFTANGSMGLGYYYESTKQWSTTTDLKTDGKVIAWKPLPESYREDEE